MKTGNSMQSLSNHDSPNEDYKKLSSSPNSRLEAAEIQTWLISYIAKNLEIDSQQIEINIPFNRYGLDSSAMIMITADLSDWLGEQLKPTIAYKYPTIESLSEYLASKEVI